MSADRFGTLRYIGPPVLAAAFLVTGWAATAQDQAEFVVQKVAEKPLSALPEGELYWHAETFGTIEEAKAAETPQGVAAEAGGKAWLLTLGAKDLPGGGGEPVATVGPIDRFDAPEYLMRVNVSDAPPGAKTSIHSHPGSEAIYILSGEATIRWPDRTDIVSAGETLAGAAPDTAMEAASTGDEKLVELIMFLVDSSEPFSSPAELH